MVIFGQVVVGPPGSGKSTYCSGMKQYFQTIGRPSVVVNVDPANDMLPYDVDIDIRSIIDVDSVMREHNLGPNGALLFCMEYLLTNLDWLEDQIKKYSKQYVIMDFPGQIELYTHYTTVHEIVHRMQKSLDARLTAVHLVDSTFCTETLKYISALLTSLSTQIQLELPHINVLSKWDILKTLKAELDFDITFYTSGSGLSHLLYTLISNSENPFEKKVQKFNEALCELIEDYNLVSFHLLDIERKENVEALIKLIDTSNGYHITPSIDIACNTFEDYDG